MGAVSQAPARTQPNFPLVRVHGLPDSATAERAEPRYVRPPISANPAASTAFGEVFQIQEDTLHPHGYIRTILPPVEHSPPLIPTATSPLYLGFFR